MEAIVSQENAFTSIKHTVNNLSTKLDRYYNYFIKETSN